MKRLKRTRLPDDQPLNVLVRAGTYKTVSDASHAWGLPQALIVDTAVRLCFNLPLDDDTPADLPEKMKAFTPS